MATLIVAATSPGAGKTALTAAVASHLASGDRKINAASAWAATGQRSGDNDVHAALGDTAQLQPLGTESDSTATVASRVRELSGPGQIAVIEGKTGDHAANLALAEETDGLVVLVAQLADDTLPAASSYGSRLAGVIINAVSRYRTQDVETRIIPDLKSANIRVLGWIPEDRRLLAPTLRLVADHLSADIILNEDESDRLIDNFLIGGMILDWGPLYFGSQENVGVVVRGDRPDIQLAALQTDTVRALVLTNGARPVEYVIYEAMQRSVPLVLTDGSTEETTARLESLQARIRFDHPDKMARMNELASECLDLDALDGALSQPVTR
jgi:BioD-like phosphotransacetylase family protein